jgi:alpha-L-fucosidase
LLSKVKKANLLDGTDLKYEQQGRYLTIDLSGIKKDEIASVVEVWYMDDLKIASIIAQSLDKTIQLDRIAGNYDKDELITSWTFTVEYPGTYHIQLLSNEKGRHSNPVWEGADQKGSIEVAGKIITVVLTRDKEKIDPTLFFYKEITCNIGAIEFPKKGTYSLHLKGFEIGAGKWTKGLGLRRILLTN